MNHLFTVVETPSDDAWFPLEKAVPQNIITWSYPRIRFQDPALWINGPLQNIIREFLYSIALGTHLEF